MASDALCRETWIIGQSRSRSTEKPRLKYFLPVHAAISNNTGRTKPRATYPGVDPEGWLLLGDLWATRPSDYEEKHSQRFSEICTTSIPFCAVQIRRAIAASGVARCRHSAEHPIRTAADRYFAPLLSTLRSPLHRVASY